MITIAWDVDDVLNDLMRQWFEIVWKKAHPECKIDYEDLSENPPYQILNITKEQYLKSLDAFRIDTYYNQMIPTLPIKEWFIHHGHKFRHITLSAVPYAAAGESARWVITHFGKWIRTFHFIPSYRQTCKIPVYDQSKEEFLKRIRQVDYLIDDNEDNIKGAESVSVKGILFPRPWNSQRDESIESVLTFLSSLK
jgi:5'(3')-deoxyribonucleotidase